MAIPNYQNFMNAVLKVYAEHKDEVLKRMKIVETVCDDLNISEEDRGLVISSGETVVSSRIYWATYYMYRAGLLERPQRGYYKITDEGLKANKSGDVINDEYLMRYPSFVEYINKSGTDSKSQDTNLIKQEPVDDPEQQMENAFRKINSDIEDEILNSLKKVEPRHFEIIVKELMEKMHYGTGELTQYVADGGIDGIISEDELGLSKIYLQAKRYNDGKVNEKEVRDFLGALADHHVEKAVFITTSCFAPKAQMSAKGAKHYTVRLIDGRELATLMRKYNLGAKQKKQYDIKEFDASYFD